MVIPVLVAGIQPSANSRASW